MVPKLDPVMDAERCAACGEDTGAGSPRFVGRRRVEGGYLCSDCAQAGRGADEDREIPVTMPNTNFPNTH